MRRTTFALLATGLLAAGPASAAQDLFFCAQNLKGDATATGFLDCINVLTTSEAAFVEGNVAEARDFRFTKFIDTASPALRRVLVSRAEFPEGTFWFRNAGSATTGPASANMAIRLLQFQVTSLASAGSGGEDRFTENVSLAARQIEFMYKAPSGAPTGPVYTCWDLDSGTAINGRC